MYQKVQFLISWIQWCIYIKSETKLLFKHNYNCVMKRAIVKIVNSILLQQLNAFSSYFMFLLCFQSNFKKFTIVMN